MNMRNSANLWKIPKAPGRRALLGWAGLLLLAAACGLALGDWFGWTW